MRKPLTTKADETPEFVEFWDAWRPKARKNDGRGDARDTFFKHVVEFGAEPADIVDGAKYFLRSLSGRDLDFIPLAASWINRRAYEDMAEAERAYQQRALDRQQQKTNVVSMNVVLPKNHFLNRAGG